MICKRVEAALRMRKKRELDKKLVLGEMLKRFDTWQCIKDLPAGTAKNAKKRLRFDLTAFSRGPVSQLSLQNEPMSWPSGAPAIQRFAASVSNFLEVQVPTPRRENYAFAAHARACLYKPRGTALFFAFFTHTSWLMPFSCQGHVAQPVDAAHGHRMVGDDEERASQ